MHKLHWLVLGAAAALLVNAGSAAAAPPDFGPAEKLCAAQGGFLVPFPGQQYQCQFVSLQDLSDGERRAARALCEKAYKGHFAVASGPEYYSCGLSS